MAESYRIDNEIVLDYNEQYVELDLNGSIIFESGSAVVREDAKLFLQKIARILVKYKNCIIEIEGHTDNVPISSGRYEDNNVLSMYRALEVADYIRAHSNLNPAYIKSSGRGEYAPIASNDTAEGRARNRRVEIKIYNSYTSQIEE